MRRALLIATAAVVAFGLTGCGEEEKKAREQLKNDLSALQSEVASLRSELSQVRGEMQYIANEAFRVGFENERRKAMERAQQAAQARPPVAPTPPRRSSNR